MVKQLDLSNQSILDAQEQLLESYYLEALHEKYHLPKQEVSMTTQWFPNARAKHVINKVLKL